MIAPRLGRIFAFVALSLLTGLSLGDVERWYVLDMQGQRAGYMVERETTADGRIVSEAESHLTVRRGATEIVLVMKSRFVETEHGEPVEMSAETSMGGAPTRDRYVFGADGVEWTSTQQGRETTQTLPLPGGRWLPPAAAGRYTAQRLAAGAESITVRTVDPLNGLDPVTTTRTGFAPVTIEVMGRSVSALKCRSLSSLYPSGEGVEYIDERGELLRSELSLGAMSITILAADEALARAELDPPELMRSVFVKPDRPLDDPYRARRGVFVVRATTGDLPDLPTAGSQRAERIDGAAVRVRRDLSQRAEPSPDADTAALTAPTAMLNSNDARVLELTRTALTAAPDDPAARAEALRRFVHRHIRTKDLSVGFASAAETARTREGDCTEHAVLLAAMLRADGIPSRVVSGLIYADRFAGGEDIFGYHMWAQALLPGGAADGAGPAWVDLDATLPEGLPMTATHIALGVSDLPGDSRVNALVELAPLMGRLAIEVESIE